MSVLPRYTPVYMSGLPRYAAFPRGVTR
jgi:hypothetical protein